MAHLESTVPRYFLRSMVAKSRSPTLRLGENILRQLTEQLAPGSSAISPSVKAWFPLGFKSKGPISRLRSRGRSNRSTAFPLPSPLPDRVTEVLFAPLYKNTGPVLRLHSSVLRNMATTLGSNWPRVTIDDLLASRFHSEGPIPRLRSGGLANPSTAFTLDSAALPKVANKPNPVNGGNEARTRPPAERSSVRNHNALAARGYDVERDRDVYGRS